MSAQIVPLTYDPDQTLQVALNVDGKTLTLGLEVKWNATAGYWVMTITDPTTGTTLLDAVPLITGAYPSANILGQYGYLAIGSAYIINAGGVEMDSPDDTNLGTDFVLLWDDTAP